MTFKEKIKRSIKRSEKAYELYLEDRVYFRALRIYNANKIVYLLLEEFIYQCEDVDLDQLFFYLFHLEDWFESFEYSRISEPALNDPFIFERLSGSPAFPVDFIENVLKT